MSKKTYKIVYKFWENGFYIGAYSYINLGITPKKSGNSGEDYSSSGLLERKPPSPKFV
jgi:hypothetical protein